MSKQAPSLSGTLPDASVSIGQLVSNVLNLEQLYKQIGNCPCWMLGVSGILYHWSGIESIWSVVIRETSQNSSANRRSHGAHRFCMPYLRPWSSQTTNWSCWLSRTRVPYRCSAIFIPRRWIFPSAQLAASNPAAGGENRGRLLANSGTEHARSMIRLLVL